MARTKKPDAAPAQTADADEASLQMEQPPQPEAPEATADPAPDKPERPKTPYVQVKAIKRCFVGGVMRQPGQVFITETEHLGSAMVVMEEVQGLTPAQEQRRIKQQVATPWNGLLEPDDGTGVGV